MTNPNTTQHVYTPPIQAKEPEKQLDWEFCGYDAPFIPGPLRRNEVWVDLKMTEEQVKQKLAAVDGAGAGAATK